MYKEKRVRLFVFLILLFIIILCMIIFFRYKKSANQVNNAEQVLNSEQVLNTEQMQIDQPAIITQYEDKSGKQGEFYTIQKNQIFIIVDGGNKENADYVRQIIKEQGENHVSLWIITHPHPDHVGAFNEIFADHEGIQIDEVRTIDLNYEHYKECAKDWDDFNKYDKFLSVLHDGKEDTVINYVQTGDTWKTGDLVFRVISAYDENVIDPISHDLCNDGSMMFKVTNKRESMLFCADVGKKVSKEILETQSQYLPSDYVQMGHHGNGGPCKKFYELVNPRIAFFDAPEWLMYPEEPVNNQSDKQKKNKKKYKTRRNIKRMEALGAEIYYYATAPNSIELN